MPRVNDLVKKAYYNTKIDKIKCEIPNVSNLVKKQIMMLRSMRLEMKYPTLMI